ncbi:MAG TPA: RNA-binding domain-containing protein [Candidatus Lokiarchaeia archaeon]|nr:RNA-binding domain-containing protein [Candidatus Lokiarchaeia archaeon]
MIHVRINTSIYATEDADRVLTAMKKMFIFNQADVVEEPKTELVTLKIDPGIQYEVNVTRIILEFDDTACLSKLQTKIHDNYIQECARSILYDSKTHLDGETFRVSFKIHKQAAFMDVLHFTEMHESPLGPINVDVTSDDIDGFIDWIAPRESREQDAISCKD